MDETRPTIATPLQAPPKSHKGALWFLGILVVLLLGAAAWLGWQWYTLNERVKQLETEKQQLQAQLDTLVSKQADTANDDTATAPCDGTITQAFKDTLKAAVESKNYAALETRMATEVNVVIAASEAAGKKAPAQAVTDMAYLGTGTSPWDFNLPAATLAGYDAGDYGQYFDSNSFVGKAANNILVSFDFDDCAKINQVFMATDGAL